MLNKEELLLKLLFLSISLWTEGKRMQEVVQLEINRTRSGLSLWFQPLDLSFAFS